MHYGTLKFLMTKRQKRAVEAADQLYKALQQSTGGFELPAEHSTDSAVMDAVVAMLRKYPDCRIVLQGRTMVVTNRPPKVGEQAWNMLDKNGYIVKQDTNKERLIDQHVALQGKNEVDSAAAEAEAMAESAKLNAVEVTSATKIDVSEPALVADEAAPLDVVVDVQAPAGGDVEGGS